MFIIMAVQTQQFPVASVLGIIIVIVIAMMDRQLMEVLVVEFTATTTANPGIELERLFPVGKRALILFTPSLCDDPVQPVLV